MPLRTWDDPLNPPQIIQVPISYICDQQGPHFEFNLLYFLFREKEVRRQLLLKATHLQNSIWDKIHFTHPILTEPIIIGGVEEDNAFCNALKRRMASVAHA